MNSNKYVKSLFSKEINEAKKLISKEVKPKKNKMHSILGIDKDKKISDVYTSGKKLAQALVDKVGKKKAASMLAFAANINKDENVYDKALRAIDTIKESLSPLVLKKINESLTIIGEYEGQPEELTYTDEDLMASAKNCPTVDSFVKYITVGSTNDTDSLSKEDQQKLRDWFNNVYLKTIKTDQPLNNKENSITVPDTEGDIDVWNNGDYITLIQKQDGKRVRIYVSKASLTNLVAALNKNTNESVTNEFYLGSSDVVGVKFKFKEPITFDDVTYNTEDEWTITKAEDDDHYCTSDKGVELCLHTDIMLGDVVMSDEDSAKFC